MSDAYFLEPMSRDILRGIYEEHLVHDFPPAERKPLRAMEKLMDAGRYQGHVLCREPGRPLAYALLWSDPEGGYVLLDYLALCQGQPHGAGLGSNLLRLLKLTCRHHRGVLVEAEAEEADLEPEENIRRLRRLEFYRQSGFRDLGYQARIFGVRYAMLFWGQGEEDEVMEAHQRLYHFEFNPWLYRKFVKIPEG